ncbi:hypothetical protein SAY86_013066 [Trapa natans]|uniref:Uncharacterized protein n=1 Tax=Trapa natans TaxID=22666 RepID=A0AAN7LYZ8_TRANT|nr:hypothetical protein SAY86_013066 [Trapa natans]
MPLPLPPTIFLTCNPASLLTISAVLYNSMGWEFSTFSLVSVPTGRNPGRLVLPLRKVHHMTAEGPSKRSTGKAVRSQKEWMQEPEVDTDSAPVTGKGLNAGQNSGQDRAVMEAREVEGKQNASPTWDTKVKVMAREEQILINGGGGWLECHKGAMKLMALSMLDNSSAEG